MNNNEFMRSNIYVADNFHHCVQVLTSSGQLIDRLSVSACKWSPKGIAIDSKNTVYVSDGYTVSVFDSKRQFIKQFEATSRPKHSNLHDFLIGVDFLLYLTGLAVDYTGNLLLVLPDRETIAVF